MQTGTTRIASSNPRNAFLVLAVLLLAALPGIAVHLGCLVVPEDDAFIVYRYVDRFTRGTGLVYNDGERVFGVTSPLYVAWLAALKSALPGVAIPVLSIRGNLFFYLTAAAALWLVVQGLVKETLPAARPAAWASAGTAAFLLQPEMMRISIGGMESFLFVTLLLASLVASFRHRRALAFFAAGLATLARPEGVLLLALLPFSGGTCHWNLRGVGIAWVAYAIPIACWAFPATLYFGTPIPHSIIAKNAPLYPLEAGVALRSVLDQFGFWAAREASREWGGFGAAGAFLAQVLVVFGAARAGLRSRAVLALLVLFVAFYGVSNPLIFEWYWPPLYAAWLLAWLAGGTGWFSRFGAVGRWVIGGLLATWWIGTLGSDASDLLRIAKRAMDVEGRADVLSLGRSRDPIVGRIHTYREVAHWLNSNTRDAVVASAEIGALGYHYVGAILDTCGLVSPAAVAFHPVPLAQRGMAEISAIPRELLRSELPDYVVTMPVFARKSLFEWDWFGRHYREVKTFSLDLAPGRQLWGGREIALFQRRVQGESPAATR